jgi:MFS family permease
MQGNLNAGTDEATWVLTSYLVSNAVILLMTGWLARVFGRKRFLIRTLSTNRQCSRDIWNITGLMPPCAILCKAGMRKTSFVITIPTFWQIKPLFAIINKF